MTETSSAQPSLSTMRLAELQQLASSMGLKGISRMRKSELVAAIRGGASGGSAATPARAPRSGAASGDRATAATNAPVTETAAKRDGKAESAESAETADSH